MSRSTCHPSDHYGQRKGAGKTHLPKTNAPHGPGRKCCGFRQGNAEAARIDLADTVAFQRDGVGRVQLRLIALVALADTKFCVGEWGPVAGA
jgi:hypothetical protein